MPLGSPIPLMNMAGLTWIGNEAVAIWPIASCALTVMLKQHVKVGVPLIVPVELTASAGFHAGPDTDTRLQLTGGTPTSVGFSANVALYAVFTCPAGSGVLAISSALMRIRSVCVP